VVITRHGRPAAEVIPFEGPPEAPLFGRSAGSTRILGDIKNTGEVWNAES
jgi:antitoxin (DNA-binding transcriptional repressor) of toxin-antitoxin stability system